MNNNNKILFEDIQLHLSNPNFEVRMSEIHGLGLFTRKDLKVHTILGPVLFHQSISDQYKYFLTTNFNKQIKPDFVQTTATRYINHSIIPNCSVYFPSIGSKTLYLKAIQDIISDNELTVNYLEFYELTGVKALPAFLTMNGEYN